MVISSTVNVIVLVKQLYMGSFLLGTGRIFTEKRSNILKNKYFTFVVRV